MAKKARPRRTLTPEDRRYVGALKDWLEQVDGLLELLQGGRPLVGGPAIEARRQFAAFKTGLRVEVKRLARLDRRGELNGFADTDYAPAIRQASADLTVRVNSTPGPAWFSELYGAQITLHYPLPRLETKR
jgi:hypothetical protein